MENARIKIIHYSWWIGGIIGIIIGLSRADGRINTYGNMFIGGLMGGIVGGCILGYIIDLIKDSETAEKIAKKIGEFKEEKELIAETKDSLNEYNEAKHRFQFLSKETLIQKYRIYESENISDMQRLALEEELVKRGVLPHSPMHEKLDKMKSLFKDMKE